MEALLRQVLRGTAVRLCAIVWLFGYVLVDITAAAQGRSAPGLMLLANLPLMALGIAQSIALGLLLDRLEGVRAPVRWGAVALAGLIAAMVQTVADHLVLAAVALTVLPDWQGWALGIDASRKFTILVLYLWTYYLALALTWASRSADSAKMNAARAAAFAAAAARAEAAALRLQLNPHFLFNTLNAIASLVVRDRQEQAEEMIGRLADFLRASLVSDPAGLVPLDQEVATARAYLTIEEARFGTRLRIDCAIDPAAGQVDVPNFILQPLVENAIKHGAAPVRGPVTISIAARVEDRVAVLSVANTASARPPRGGGRAGVDGERSGIGLANTRSRLAMHYGASAWMECGPTADGYRVELGVPIDPHRLDAAA
ncbi:histidine kinase [Sphingomonas donggukensis]|uniref:Histidine kinase n=1 Tax=Sphingomonas donggukensis TaxID=2949093 RepID=A0ABY4TRF5_9SPHN|nr:histidine kinase [Sphingomonas donggukensis]URW74883.1 histidine kinase [Sphingomonas donggukensis]